MLCKTTMRAALAPMIGLVGVLVATSAAAEVVIGGKQGFVSATNQDANPPQRFAAESLHDDGCVGTPCSHFRVTASVGELLLTAQTDILLPGGTYYLRYDLTNAVFTAQIGTTDVEIDNTIPTPAGAPSPVPSANVGTERVFTALGGTPALAYKGNRGDASIILQLAGLPETPVGSWFALDLSGAADDASTTDVNELHSQLAVKAGHARASIAVYDSLSDARAQSGALFEAGPTTIASTSSVTSVTMTSMHDVADVSTSNDDGGPFRRFVPGGMGGKDSGVLGKVTINFNPHGFKDTTTNMAATDALIASTSISVESAAGNFAVSTKHGELNKDAGGGKPWMVADNVGCTNGPLTLGLVGGELATYDADQADPDGEDGPLPAPKKGDLTPAGIQAANKANGTAAAKVGDNYFCVLVKGNLDPIPEIGDPDSPASYKLTAHPQVTTPAMRPAAARPAAKTMNIGAIDRNGTTVHIPYLSTHAAYNQRLVLVNRGDDAAKFWIEDDSFNLETDTTLMTNALSPAADRSIPKNGRLVVRVQDEISFNGMTRGAATVNVAAPTRNIDVMTIQVHPGTGQVDTTVYQAQ